MKRNYDYYEEEIEATEEVIQTAMELSDIIEEKLVNRPGKGNNSFRQWKKDTNDLIDRYNRDFGKAYVRIK